MAQNVFFVHLNLPLTLMNNFQDDVMLCIYLRSSLLIMHISLLNHWKHLLHVLHRPATAEAFCPYRPLPS